MDQESREHFVFAGGFSPREISRVTDHLEKLDVEYEVEFDDSELRNMSPLKLYGDLTSGVVVNLYVDPGRMLEVEAVIETLYPP